MKRPWEIQFWLRGLDDTESMMLVDVGVVKYGIYHGDWYYMRLVVISVAKQFRYKSI
jgi:hypothetical protein